VNPVTWKLHGKLNLWAAQMTVYYRQLHNTASEWVSTFLMSHQRKGYTVPFTPVHARKYVTEDKSKTDTLQKLNTTQKKQTTQNTAKQN